MVGGVFAASRFRLFCPTGLAVRPARSAIYTAIASTVRLRGYTSNAAHAGWTTVGALAYAPPAPRIRMFRSHTTAAAEAEGKADPC